MTIDPNRFRTTHYGARRYWDREPACKIAEPSDTKLLNVTAIAKAVDSAAFFKKLDSGARVPLDALRVADYAVENWERLSDQRADERRENLALSAGRDLTRAADRGTAVHGLIEGLIAGQAPLILDDEAEQYQRAAEAVAAHYKDRITHTELVCFSRDGSRPDHLNGAVQEFAGTGDALAVGGASDGGSLMIDWKSRGPDSKHGCYPKEVGQLGLLSLCGYFFAIIDGELVRVRMPEITELHLVSIRPDGFEVYPVSVEAAQEVAIAALELDATKRSAASTARRAVGDPLLPIPNGSPQPGTAPAAAETAPPEGLPSTSGGAETRREWFAERYDALVAAGHKETVQALWVEDLPGPKRCDEWTDDQLGEALGILDKAEDRHEMPFPHPDPEAPPPPPRRTASRPAVVPLRDRSAEDGGPVLPADVDDLRTERFDLLGKPQRELVMQWRTEGAQAGHDWHLGKGGVSERIFEIAATAIDLAPLGAEDARSILALVIGEDDCQSHPTGALLGTLSIAEAQHVAELAGVGVTAAREQLAAAVGQ